MSEFNIMDGYKTTQEIADMYGVHRCSVGHLCNIGKIPDAYFDGKSWQIPDSALDSLKDIIKPNHGHRSWHGNTDAQTGNISEKKAARLKANEERHTAKIKRKLQHAQERADKAKEREERKKDAQFAKHSAASKLGWKRRLENKIKGA